MHKNINDFYLFGCTNKDLTSTNDINNYKLNESPLINGKETNLKIAIEELKKTIKSKKTIHFDGLICDQNSQNLILNWSESLRSSINHSESEEINNFYSAYQIYGGSLVSFNEVKKRSDLILFIGDIDDSVLAKFIRKLDWKNSKISVQRFKGLGEMNPSQLRETTMNADTRRLVQLTLDSNENTNHLMDMLLSKKRSPDRRVWLEDKGNLANVS